MGQKRVLGQRFDAAGLRLWGNTGLVVSDYSPAAIGLIRTAQDGSDTVVYWWEQVGWGDERMTGARVAASGALVCAPFPVSSYPSSKAYPEAAAGSGGVSVIAWKDGRADVGDVYAQNVNRDCTLGNPAP